MIKIVVRAILGSFLVNFLANITGELNRFNLISCNQDQIKYYSNQFQLLLSRILFTLISSHACSHVFQGSSRSGQNDRFKILVSPNFAVFS